MDLQRSIDRTTSGACELGTAPGDATGRGGAAASAGRPPRNERWQDGGKKRATPEEGARAWMGGYMGGWG